MIAAGSSNGIPVQTDETFDITPAPVAVPVAVDATETARRMVPLTFKQRFLVLQQLQEAADRSRVHFDAEAMPHHDLKASGVRIFSNHWRRLSKWLKAQDALNFREVHVDLVIPPDRYEAALALLKSIASTVPAMSHRAIAAGHVGYVFVAFRDD